MHAYLIFDLILVGLLAFSALRGAKRGLVLSLCSLAAALVAFIGAGVAARALSPVVADALEPRFAAAIEQRLNESMEDTAASEAHPAEDEDSPLQPVLKVLRDMGLYDTLVSGIDKAVSEGTSAAAASAAARVAAAVAQSVAYLIIFLAAFLLILLAWRVISRALDLLARLPGLHFLNKTLGAAFGLAQCCILLFVAAWLMQFMGNVIPRETVEQTHLLKFFMTTNPLALLNSLRLH